MNRALPLAALLIASPAAAQETPPAAPPQHDMAGMDMSRDMAGMDMSRHGMTGAYGAYPMNREASGTSWQPDLSEHQGFMVMRGPWMVMVHGLLTGVYDSQNGARGDDK